MVLKRTENTRYNTDRSFGENINKFQDWNIKNVRTLERKQIFHFI